MCNAKKPLAGPDSVVQYLGKYTHREAISNSRLVSVCDGKISFRWKGYRKRLSKQLLTLEAQEFIGRFMRHIFPSGFYKIRYYGLLASINGKKKERCMRLIGKDRLCLFLNEMMKKNQRHDGNWLNGWETMAVVFKQTFYKTLYC